MSQSLQFSIREALASEASLLRRALVLAVLWRSSEPPDDFAVALRDSAYWSLLDNWGANGDCAVIGESAGQFLGAAWYRFWTEKNHSYGFVSASVPELGIGVHHPWRGLGVGSALLSALCRRAADAGAARVSLSVEADNPARRLYGRHGFADHSKVGGAFTMVKNLRYDQS